MIEKLKQSNLYAECCHCSDEFKISEAILFDGTKPFPEEALEEQKRLKEALRDRAEELKKRKKRATENAEITAKSVNVGKSLEKVLPTMKDFKWNLSECRFLGDPIDLVTFNGIIRNSVQSISFIEVKSGGARLNQRQKCIRDAIDDKKLLYREFK